MDAIFPEEFRAPDGLDTDGLGSLLADLKREREEQKVFVDAVDTAAKDGARVSVYAAVKQNTMTYGARPALLGIVGVVGTGDTFSSKGMYAACNGEALTRGWGCLTLAIANAGVNRRFGGPLRDHFKGVGFVCRLANYVERTFFKPHTSLVGSLQVDLFGVIARDDGCEEIVRAARLGPTALEFSFESVWAWANGADANELLVRGDVDPHLIATFLATSGVVVSASEEPCLDEYRLLAFADDEQLCAEISARLEDEN